MKAKLVVEIMSFRCAFGGHSYYYVYPVCHVTLEREFMAYCDRYGQWLDWKKYKDAKVLPVSR